MGRGWGGGARGQVRKRLLRTGKPAHGLKTVIKHCAPRTVYSTVSEFDQARVLTHVRSISPIQHQAYVNHEIQTHLYERIDETFVEPAFLPPKTVKSSSKYLLKKIVENEQKLKQQTEKIVKLDSSIVKHVKNVKRIISQLNSLKNRSI